MQCFIIVADYCATSAGNDEIDIANYHILSFTANLLEYQNQKIEKQRSQIDVFQPFSLISY